MYSKLSNISVVHKSTSIRLREFNLIGRDNA